MTNKSGAPGSGKTGRLTLPTKRSVNLAVSSKKKTNTPAAILAIILIIAAAAAFSKFAVIDRLTKMSNAEQAVVDVETQIKRVKADIASFGDLEEQYQHYRTDLMSKDELERIPRVKVVELIRNIVLPEAFIEGFELKGNKLTVSVTDDSLLEVNQIARKLEEEPLVEYCEVIKSETNDRDVYGNDISDLGKVTAKIDVYLLKESDIKEAKN